MSIPQLRGVIGQAVERDPSIIEKSMEHQLRRLILEPSLEAPVETSSPFLVIVDGLDECKDKTIQVHIIRLITQLVSSPSLPLCFLVASRPEPHLREAFDEPHCSPIVRRVVLDESFWPSRDIDIYLRDTLAEIYRQRNFLRDVRLPWPSESAIDHL